MMADAAQADVLLVNPTHVAVALKYDRTKGGAPVCVAKGADLVALRIREVAEANSVPVIEDKPRALLKALAAGLPVIASPACWLPPQPGLTLVPSDEPMVLATALLALLPSPNSLSAKPRKVITRIGGSESLSHFRPTP